jgi:hypothetical protein
MAILLIHEMAEPSMNETFRGIMIEVNRDRRNAFASIRFSCESLLKEINENDSQRKKQPEPITSTFFGTTISFNADLENASDPISVS